MNGNKITILCQSEHQKIPPHPKHPRLKKHFFSSRNLFTMSYINIVLNIIPTLYEGYIVSVHILWLWKIVLLTLAASRGVTDLYPS